MADQQQPYSSRGCDESKCVSIGRSSQHYNRSFTCYGDEGGGYFPMMCADGYLPRVVNEEPPIVEFEETLQRELSFRYFTCCPPTLPSDTVVARHCSGPKIDTTDIANDPEEITEYIDIDENSSQAFVRSRLCDNTKRPFPRQMNSRRYFPKVYRDSDVEEIESHVCCDVESTDGGTNSTSATKFWNETECVPYHNEWYDASEVRNSWGTLAAIACNFPEAGGTGFGTPRLRKDSSPLRYDCCKTGDPSPPFVRDVAFNLTIYPQILLSTIAVVSSTVIILALSIPLLKHLRQQRGPRSEPPAPFPRCASRTSSRRLKFRSRSFDESDISGASENLEESVESDMESVVEFIDMLRRNIVLSLNKFSTFNLYLVYLAIPDLFINLYVIGTYTIFAFNKVDPGLCGTIINSTGVLCTSSDLHGMIFLAISGTYYTANIYLNVVVAYEVYGLLKDSKNFKIRNPPSTRKVTLQAVAVCIFSIVIGIIYSGQDVAKYNGNEKLASIFALISLVVINQLLWTYLPLGYLIYICVKIRRRELLPSAFGLTSMDQAVRDLALYFLRIVAVFFGCYLPLTAVFPTSAPNSIALIIVAMQQILSTCVALTNSVVRKQVIDLFKPASSAQNVSKEESVPTSVNFGSTKASESRPENESETSLQSADDR